MGLVAVLMGRASALMGLVAVLKGSGVCFNGVGRRFNGAPRRCLRMAAARKIVCRRSRSGALLPEKEPNVAESRSVTLVQGRYRLCCGGRERNRRERRERRKSAKEL